MGNAKNFPLFFGLFLFFLSHLRGKHIGVAFLRMQLD
jgi:hypothetical protein